MSLHEELIDSAELAPSRRGGKRLPPLIALRAFEVVARRSRYYSQPDEDALILWRENLAKPT